MRIRTRIQTLYSTKSKEAIVSREKFVYKFRGKSAEMPLIKIDKANGKC